MITEFEIEHHFIERFRESHGEPRDGFASALYKRIPSNATVSSLEAASEYLIRLKGKTFPAVADCLNAIIKMSGAAAVTSISAGRVEVTATNFTQIALDIMRPRQQFGVMGCMIEPGSPEWGLWVAYFIAKQIPSLRMARIEAFARHKTAEGEVEWRVTDRFMVPSRYPMEFDASAPAMPTTWGDYAAELRRRPRFVPTSEKAA